ERAAHEIGGALRRAANAAHLHHPFRLDAHLEHGVDDALRDGVVPASGAQRGFAATILHDRQTNMIQLRARGPIRSCGGHYKPSLVRNSSLMLRASMGNPL